jgi:hypothetical protein
MSNLTIWKLSILFGVPCSAAATWVAPKPIFEDAWWMCAVAGYALGTASQLIAATILCRYFSKEKASEAPPNP